MKRIQDGLGLGLLFSALALGGCAGEAEIWGSDAGASALTGQPDVCGDRYCAATETCASCASDCGICYQPVDAGGFETGGTTPGGGSMPGTNPPPTPSPTPSPTTVPDAGPTLPNVADCVAASGAALQDQDFDDDQLPWRRTAGTKVVIYFETRNVTPEYIPDMQKGAENWNKSPCLDVRLIGTCLTGTNCVTFTAPNPNTDGDGNFDAIETGGFTRGGHIDVLNGLSVGERLNVVVHEMGHAVGLRHRLKARVLMNPDTYSDVFVSDPVDYQNLLVLYGNQK
ncbi:MAG: hypothetical protein ACT4TC_15935 [Myxococcaceae bacterium]